jgi:hypothetical protein
MLSGAIASKWWSSVISLTYLGKTKLFFYGSVDLGSSKWKNLKKINLSMLQEIQVRIKLMMPSAWVLA